MTNNQYNLPHPADAILFDCDGTLSAIEGIDFLATLHGVASEVHALTEEAMGKTGLTPAIYETRLQLVKPTKSDVIALGDKYVEQITPDAKEVIVLLSQLNKNIYLVSAGLHPAVSKLAAHLGIPETHVYAVDIQFDHADCYQDFDRKSPLTTHHGKREIANLLHQKHKQLVHIGDGLNDIVLKDVVARFIGFGGHVYREKIANAADVYVTSRSLTGILPYVLTENEIASLTPPQKKLYARGLS